MFLFDTPYIPVSIGAAVIVSFITDKLLATGSGGREGCLLITKVGVRSPASLVYISK